MNLLVAIDFSETTEELITHTGTLASALRAKVFLLHVVAPATPVLDMENNLETLLPAQEKPESKEEALPENRAHEQLHEIAEILESQGLEVSAHLAHNDEVKAIIEAAERFGVGMIILGSHGHGALYHLLIGSVSEGVVRRAQCPVVIVPARRK
ncbi:MAG: universal stress protein [Chlorobium sp.]|uniref:universal stress protein n=1 Tax=Chlorobium sp. TaxID=1095 RepID=UPI0025C3F8F8|nr:universal stress protein [Chlorobium sp.]MCF8383261.1 universal stress protein [Chlorobium sp.]